MSNGVPIDWTGDIPSGNLWLGCNDNNWHNEGNWKDGVPEPLEEVHVFPTLKAPIILPGSIAFAGNLNIHNNAILANAGIYAGYADIIIDNGANLTGNGDYYLGENWENNGTFSSGTSTVTFNGPLPGEISGSSNNTFYNLDIDKYTNDAMITIEDDISVTGELSVTVGELDILTGKTVSTDLVEIESNGSFTNSGTLTGNLMELKSNGAFTNNGTFNIADVNIDGTLSNDGILKVVNFLWLRDGGTAQGNGEYQMETAFAAVPGATFIAGTSKVIMNGGNSVNTIFLSGNNNIDFYDLEINKSAGSVDICLLYTSPSPRDS